MGATSLGDESTKTVVSGVSDLDANLHNEMSDLAAGLTSRDSRAAAGSATPSVSRGENTSVQDTVFQANERLRPKAYNFDDSTSNASVPTHCAEAPGLQKPGSKMATIAGAPSTTCVKGTVSEILPVQKQVIPPSLDDGRVIDHVLAPVVPHCATLVQYYPSFLKRHGSTSRHQVVADEVDRELMLDVGGEDPLPGESDLSALIAMEKENDDEKEDVWNRLTEMTTFAMAGFGFFKTSLGTGAYKRERRASSLRQGITNKDRFWGSGLRVTIGNRVAYASASLSWGCFSEKTASEDALLLADCAPMSADAYEAFAPDAKKLEPRGKPPSTIDRLSRCAKQQIELFSSVTGKNIERNGWTH